MTYELFFVLGLTIFTGFITTLIFEKTRISQVLLLMLFGFLLGPLFHVVDVSPNSIIVSILPFVASLALIVLLFDAGLMIDLFAVARAIPRSTVFTFLVFCLGLLLVTSFFVLFFQWPLLHGVLLGAVAGGTSSAIVIAMVEKARITKETKSLLTIESTITDALCIIVAVIAIQLIISNESPSIGTVANLLFSSFSVAIVLGVISAVIWIFAIQRKDVSKYAYMLTLALVFGLYALAETFKGNGGFTVFIFGMVLGNSKDLGRLLRIRHPLEINPMIRLFQEEITFFVRTFFFVYIGLLLSPAYFSPYILLISIALLVLFALSRWLIQKFILGDLSVKDKNIVVAMMPRGLAAAVLATTPLANGIVIPDFQQIVFGVILLSNVAATLGIFIYDRETGKKQKPKVEEELAEVMEGAEMQEEPEEEGVRIGEREEGEGKEKE